jgi:hypothetical protein
MSAEEERLRRLLKGAVPQPPVEVTTDQVMSRPLHGSGGSARSVRSWGVPALAAAAVVAIAVTIGVLAAHHSGPAAPVAGRATGTAQPTASTSPQPRTSCPGATVTVPNVIGTTLDAAAAILQGAGLYAGTAEAVMTSTRTNAGSPDTVMTSARTVTPGTVFAQSPAAGSRAVPGTVVWLKIGSAPWTKPGHSPNVSSSPSPCQSMAATPPAAGATARVPDVIGMTQLQAVAVAEQAGFRNVSVTIAPLPRGLSALPGTVFAQTPTAGSSAQPPGMILYVAPAT